MQGEGSFAPLKCEVCNGSGSLLTNAICKHCGGTGEIVSYDDDGGERLAVCMQCEYGLVYVELACSVCNGAGVV